MGNFDPHVAWDLIMAEDPNGSDMVDVSPITRKWLEVPYASQSPSQVVDIYLPEEGEGPFPTYIFVHGGAFIVGDKRDVQFLLAVDGVNRGYAVASVEYRRAFESKAPNALYDVKSAIRFLRAHAEEYKLDADRFALGGDSAGAYYAVFAAATNGIPAFDGPDPILPDVSGAVKAVVAQCGVYDLMTMTPPPEVEAASPKEFVPGRIPVNLISLFVGANLRLIPDLAVLLNPLTYITNGFPPTLVQVGKQDAVVPWSESANLTRVIAARCGQGNVRLEAHDAWNHCALNHILTPEFFSKENNDRTFGFLNDVL